jgi:hypothetical protein
MGKYTSFEKKRAPRHTIHPIWSGIGFLMVIIVPVMTWAAASITVDYGQKQGWPILRSFPRYLDIPAILYNIPGVGMIAKMDNFAATAVFFLFMLIIFTGIFTVLYAFIYRLVGPPRYAPDDIPAPRVTTKPFKR